MVTLKHLCSTSSGATPREADCNKSRRMNLSLDSEQKNLTGGTRAAFHGSLFRASVLVAVIFLIGLWNANAQSTFGSIRGTVEDAGAAAIPGAKVILHSTDENTDRVVSSDGSGAYTFENVPAGHYTIRGQHSGFADTVLDGITLAARQDLRFTLTMQVAAQATTVQVTASAAEINTENATIGDMKTGTTLEQLPLNYRAQTTSPLAALATSANVQQDTSGNIAIAGATSNMTGFSVDGISTVNVWTSGASLAAGAQGVNAYPSSEAISELKVSAFNNNAEFSQVADVAFTTKGGTNQFHGSLYEYLQNDALNAKTYDFSLKTPERFNTFGGSLSGPLVAPHLYDGHNKTFFFFDYEGNRKSTSLAEQYTVPTLAERQGNLSALASQMTGPLTNPFTGQPYSNDTIPSTQINSTATTLLNDYYPLPNSNTLPGGLNYQALVPTPSRTNGFDARIDQILSSKQQMFVRYNWKNMLVDVANPLLPDDVDTEHDRSFLVSHNYEFTSNLLNEFRYGFTTSIFSPSFPIEGEQALSQLGLLHDWPAIPAIHQNGAGFPTFNFSQGTNFEPIGRDIVGPFNSYTYEMTDNLTWTHGKHTLRGGFDIRWLRDEVVALETPSDDFGQITFQPTFTGNAFGDLLLGLPNTTYFAMTGPNENPVGRQYGFYAQDEWQVNDRLTINYGLRWELLPPFQDANGMAANFDPTTDSVIVNKELYTKLGGPVPSFLESFNACNAAPAGLTATNDPGYAPSTAMPCTPVVLNTQEGVGPGLRQTYLRNFDPRLSFAYRPFADDKTVVRGGFGIYTVTALGQLQNNNEGNPDITVDTYTNSLNTTTGLPTFQFPAVTPASTGIVYGGGELEQGTDPHYRDAQAAQWNLTMEHDLTSNTAVRASYVGESSYRVNQTVNVNQQRPSTVSPNPNPIPFPNWGTIFFTGNYGHENYNALELQVTHRMGSGLFYQANYTWAHDLSDAQGDAPTSFQGETQYGMAVEDRFDLRANRGNVEGTRRQRFMLTGTYELPYGHGRRWSSQSGIVNNILGGWDLSTITLLETGPYLTPTMSVSYDQTNTDPAAAGILVVRPDRVGNPVPANRTRANYFNINAFAPPPLNAGRVGNAGVGSLEGPGAVVVNGGLAKVMHIHDNLNLRFEATFTNVLNHTNFAPPSTDISVPSSFGALTTAESAENAGNRTGELALRLDF
jgi:Carboxypeptidase regulatory-like domain